jgi:PKD repeat protein
VPRRRHPTVAILGVVLPLCFAGQAWATTYCVGGAPSCTGTTEPDLQTALTKAGADTQGADTIVLPPATLTNPGGFLYGGTVPLEIDGQGEGSTTLSLPAGGGGSTVLSINGSAASVSLVGFSVVIPSSHAGAFGVSSEVPATISGVSVSSPGATSAGDGLYLLDGGTVSHVNVDLPADGGNSNGLFDTGTLTVDDAILSGGSGLQAEGNTIVHRSLLSAAGGGTALGIGTDVQAEVDDTVLVADGTSVALYDYESTLIGRQLTMVGGDQATAVDLNAGNLGGTLRLSDSIITEPFEYSFETSGNASATLAVDHSDYAHVSPPQGFVAGVGNLPAYVAPVFANATGGDYRLLASSPASLFGADSTAIQPGESSTDLAGVARFGGVLRDLGAYQHQVPTVTAASASPQPVPAGAVATFTATAADPEPNDPLSFAWDFDDGASAAGAGVSHTFTTPGTHSATVTVTDALGYSATRTVSVVVAKVAAPAPAPASFTLGRASVAKKTGVISFGLSASANGTASVHATLVRTIRTVSGRGRHRKVKVTRRTFTYATAKAKNVTANQTTALKLTPSKPILRWLKARHRAVRVTVAVSYTPVGGAVQHRSFTVSVPKRPR